MISLRLYTYSFVLFALVCQMTISGPAYALGFKTSLTQQRQDFVAAKEALGKGRMKTFNKLSKRVEDYPLYGYLRYDYFRKRLHRTPNDEIRAFISEYSDSPIGVRLQSKWLFDLARRKRWKTFLAEYENKLRDNIPRFKNTPTPATIMMGPQTLAHIVIMAFIIIGNILYFRSRKRGEQ